ncbi:MAG: hypothetical protein V1738_01960 [Patescibacteria group bacterium]
MESKRAETDSKPSKPAKKRIRLPKFIDSALDKLDRRIVTGQRMIFRVRRLMGFKD